MAIIKAKNNRLEVIRDSLGQHIKIPAAGNVLYRLSAPVFLVITLYLSSTLFFPLVWGGLEHTIETFEFGFKHLITLFILLLFLKKMLLSPLYDGANTLWDLLGKETVSLSKSEFKHTRHLLGFQRSKVYRYQSITQLKPTSELSEVYQLDQEKRLKFWGEASGLVSFDNNGTKHYLGDGLTLEEVDMMIRLIQQRIDQLG